MVPLLGLLLLGVVGGVLFPGKDEILEEEFRQGLGSCLRANGPVLPCLSSGALQALETAHSTPDLHLTDHMMLTRESSQPFMDMPREHVSALGRHLQLERYNCDYPQSLKLKTASKRRNMFYENKKQETTEIRDPRGARTFLDGIELYMEQRSFHWDMGGFYPGLYMTVGPGSKGGVLEFQLDQRKAADDRSLSTGKLLMKRTLVPLLLGLKLNLVSLTPLLFAALVLITKKAFLLSKLSFLFSGISLLNGAQNQHAAYPHYHKPPLVGGLHGPLGFRDTLIHEPELTIIDRGERTLLRRGI